MSVNPGTQHGAREALLQKIRRALQIPAPFPGHHGPSHSEGAVTKGQEPAQAQLHPPVKPGSPQGEATDVKAPKVLQSLNVVQNGPDWRQWLPPAGDTQEDWADLFARNSAGLKTEFHLLSGIEDLPEALHKLAVEAGWTKVGCHGGELVDGAVQALGLASVRADHSGYDATELAACEAGITECDALIAQTGTVLLCTRSAGGRALSVLPPHHVVLARKSQLLPDLSAAFALLHEAYGDSWPSLATFITGPSRTGDIERILVLGAHGPKRLTIFCF